MQIRLTKVWASDERKYLTLTDFWNFQVCSKFAWRGMLLVLLSPMEIQLNEIQYKECLHITMKKSGMELANTRNPKISQSWRYLQTSEIRLDILQRQLDVIIFVVVIYVHLKCLYTVHFLLLWSKHLAVDLLYGNCWSAIGVLFKRESNEIAENW